MKKTSGITLISLVVTIIILLILAGISIGLISGSDGVLGRATASVDKTNIEAAKEQVTLKIGEYQEEFYEGKYVTQEIDNASEQGDWIYENYGKKDLKVKDYEFTITLPEGKDKADEENPYVIVIQKKKILKEDVTGTLSVDGVLRWDEENREIADSGNEKDPEKNPNNFPQIEELKAGTPNYIYTANGEIAIPSRQVATTNAVKFSSGEMVPVPIGFYYVGGTIASGVVISDNQADQNKYAGQEDVPSGIEAVLNDDGSVKEVKNTLVGNQFVWVPCETSGYAKTNWGQGAVTNRSDACWDTTVDQAGTIQIKKYGGFYVGRFEAGLADDIDEFTSAQKQDGSNQVYNKDGIPQSKAGLVPWNFIDWNNSRKNAESMYNTDTVNSGLITGTQWDVMINWMTENNASELTNSGIWGNYMDKTPKIDIGRTSYTSYVSGAWYMQPYTEIWMANTNKTAGQSYAWTTGASEQSKKKNLYDVAGNMWEWTEEESKYGGNVATQYRILRGGCYCDTSVSYPVCYRLSGVVTGFNYKIGFRVVLYMK